MQLPCACQLHDSVNPVPDSSGLLPVCRLHRRKDWRLVVTGHSLGAGVAVLISTHLRCQFPGKLLSLHAQPQKLSTTH